MTLARKLRPKNFSQVVGRDLVCSMLQNSLFVGKIFSSYLFSGKRGCGKTTVARIFAAAINCEKLKAFQENPRKQVSPCLECSSCLLMARSAHPDFFELDAASNTGVENIRQILESSSYLPCLGKYKVFLIDEAHMLSKAAFNALLKTLEEPPPTAIFILATTELEKIPATIRSRSFLGFFPNLPTAVLANFLKDVCQKENISISEEAIVFLCRISQGCPRDALNLLDQMVLLDVQITTEHVSQAFGFLSSDLIFEIILHMTNNNSLGYQKIFLEKIKPYVAANIFFEQLFSVLLFLFNSSLGIEQESFDFTNSNEIIKKILQTLKTEKIFLLLKKLQSLQKNLSIINEKIVFLEFLLLELYFIVNNGDGTGGVPPVSNKNSKSQKDSSFCEVSSLISGENKVFEEPQTEAFVLSQQNDSVSKNWKKILIYPPLASQKLVCMALDCLSDFVVDDAKQEVSLVFSKKINSFLQKELELAKDVLLDAVKFSYFDSPERKELNWSLIFVYEEKSAVSPKTNQVRVPSSNFFKRDIVDLAQDSASIHDLILKNKEDWPIANLLIEHFPGKIILDKEKN